MIDKILLRLRLASRKCCGSNQIKYIYEKHRGSDLLVVVFSGFSEENAPARFNYIRTLLPLKTDKLFILDDFGYRNRGSYYLTGRSGDESLQNEILSLIGKYRGTQKLVTAGSSKGATAALLYGLRCGADAVIVGAPQYHLGTYLAQPHHRNILEGICGDGSEEAVQKLNALLPDQIRKSAGTETTVFLHCSPLEHTYEDHVKDLLADLKACNYAVHEDLDDSYSDHAKIGQYFSGYLFRTMQKIMEET